MKDGELAEFWSLLDGIGTCMMTTSEGAELHSRPMRPLIDKPARQIRFLTRRSTHNVDELAANPQVNLAFAEPAGGVYVSVTGQAYLTTDRHLIDDLWSPDVAACLGCAADDEDVAVIRVVPVTATHWSGAGARRDFPLFRRAHDGDG